ncbi:hypothetical protein PENTCL1PPCAC_7339, partial [Pristionchus entomophagus]
ERWEINNAAATLATRKAESRVFKEGGLEWVASVKSSIHHAESAKFALTCNNPRGGKWRCDAAIQFINPAIDGVGSKKHRVSFNEGNRAYFFSDGYMWLALNSLYWEFFRIDRVVIEFRINIISSEGIEHIQDIDLSKFSSPVESSNVTLVIEGKKLRVSKDYLAVRSPVFYAMLFANFAEKGKEEVEIKDVIYEEFVDLLHVIFTNAQIFTNSDRTVVHILKLADRFQLEILVDLSKKYLMESKRFDAVTKLLLADKYNIVSIRDQVLQPVPIISG